MAEGGVRFIRVRGRIVPVRDDGGGKGQGGGKASSSAQSQRGQRGQRSKTGAAVVGGAAGAYGGFAFNSLNSIKSAKKINERAKKHRKDVDDLKNRKIDFADWSKRKSKDPSKAIQGDDIVGFNDAREKFGKYSEGRLNERAAGGLKLSGQTSGGSSASVGDYARKSMNKGDNSEKFFKKFSNYASDMRAFDERQLRSQSGSINADAFGWKQKYTGKGAIKGHAKYAVAGAAIGAAYFAGSAALRNRARSKRENNR